VRQRDPAAAAEQLLAVTRDSAALWKAWWRTDDRKTTAPPDSTALTPLTNSTEP
jgi:hypothetical protein